MLNIPIIWFKLRVSDDELFFCARAAAVIKQTKLDSERGSSIFLRCARVCAHGAVTVISEFVYQFFSYFFTCSAVAYDFCAGLRHYFREFLSVSWAKLKFWDPAS